MRGGKKSIKANPELTLMLEIAERHSNMCLISIPKEKRGKKKYLYKQGWIIFTD